jgi:hypothetical protein
MAPTAFGPSIGPTLSQEQNAIPRPLLVVCFVLCLVNVSLLQTGLSSHWWIFDKNGLGIPTDFVNVWSAGRLVLDGHPALAYDWDIQKQVQVAILGQSYEGAFSLWGCLFRLGRGQFRAVSACHARDHRANVRLFAGSGVSGGVHQRAGRAKWFSHRIIDRRNALFDADAAGAFRHLSRAFEL